MMFLEISVPVLLVYLGVRLELVGKRLGRVEKHLGIPAKENLIEDLVQSPLDARLEASNTPRMASPTK